MAKTRPDHPPKSEWGDGPWRSEPDVKCWTHAGFACEARRAMATGAWCGYVGVEPGHPWYGKEYDDIDVEVHGGLTFSDGASALFPWCPEPRSDEERGLRDAVAAATDDAVPRMAYADWLRDHDREIESRLLLAAQTLWFVGFDCAHAGDRCPAMSAYTHPDFTDRSERETYRTLDYVIGHTESLAAQALGA